MESYNRKIAALERYEKLLERINETRKNNHEAEKDVEVSERRKKEVVGGEELEECPNLSLATWMQIWHSHKHSLKGAKFRVEFFPSATQNRKIKFERVLNLFERHKFSLLKAVPLNFERLDIETAFQEHLHSILPAFGNILQRTPQLPT